MGFLSFKVPYHIGKVEQKDNFEMTVMAMFIPSLLIANIMITKLI